MAGRRYDPERRRRLVDAAVRVVADRGIAGVSHRRVAREADVPLGSTTYHFASLDDLLGAALRQISEEWLAGMERWDRRTDPALPLADALTGLVLEWLAGDRTRTRLEYELYLAALNHERLRPLAAECLDGLTALLHRRTGDEATARALTALLDGLTLQFLLTDRPADPQTIRTLVARLTGPGPAGDGGL
ncbi:TetR/AcrR family transcriptional regulator [Streptomyces sp. JJ36]|uniref:TetR/AcrR family transcriptional regulator n=1 Tax=Streptomyces sp. JJ36 TaxID=2736645 RepID=UPI001F027D25|nr:TetR family transcriptional regulator [Streptomyces sp. JJ36]MCF6523363.1 TetR family transcriptional regulator [Streptomyces sp. JJ36]